MSFPSFIFKKYPYNLLAVYDLYSCLLHHKARMSSFLGQCERLSRRLAISYFPAFNTTLFYMRHKNLRVYIIYINKVSFYIIDLLSHASSLIDTFIKLDPYPVS
jgi:hypothetical protein